MEKPGTAVLLLLIGLLLLLFVYWQFAFLILGIQNIHRQTHLNFRQLALATIKKTRRLTPTTIMILIAYFVLVFPFSSIVFKTSLLAKLTIPDFIIDFILDRWYLAILVVLLYLIGTWLAVRLLPLLPALILGDEHPAATVVRSWRATRGQAWRTLFFNHPHCHSGDGTDGVADPWIIWVSDIPRPAMAAVVIIRCNH